MELPRRRWCCRVWSSPPPSSQSSAPLLVSLKAWSSSGFWPLPLPWSLSGGLVESAIRNQSRRIVPNGNAKAHQMARTSVNPRTLTPTLQCHLHPLSSFRSCGTTYLWPTTILPTSCLRSYGAQQSFPPHALQSGSLRRLAELTLTRISGDPVSITKAIVDFSLPQQFVLKFRDVLQVVVVNGKDLAEVVGGEFTHTNYHSGPGEPYVIILEFTKPRDMDGPYTSNIP